MRCFAAVVVVATLGGVHVSEPQVESRKDTPRTIEARVVCLHPESQFSADPEKGKNDVREFVERMASANFNLILAWTRSIYMAALTDEVYQKSVPIARWDALGELIKVAHEKGIAVHAWYSFTAYKNASSPDFNPKHGGDPSWAARRLDELLPDKKTGKVVPRRMEDVCPMHADARQWQLGLIDKMLDRYPLLSGIHIEEPGYGQRDNCVCELCLGLFKSIYGSDEVENILGPQAEDLKCIGTTEFMRQLRARLLKRNPTLALSTNGKPSWHDDRVRGRDWGNWARQNWIDYYIPQDYIPNVDVFRKVAPVTVTELGQDCPVFVGIAIEWSAGKCTQETVLTEIEIARSLGAKGIVLFHGKVLTDEWLAALKSGPFKEPAALPALRR